MGIMGINELASIICESISEIMAYHGTGANFDRFNHKKYLSNDFDSHCFGWGTYVTDDVAIASSCADNDRNVFSLELDGDDLTNEDVFRDSLSSNTDLNGNTIYSLYKVFSAYKFDIDKVISHYINTNRETSVLVSDIVDIDEKNLYLKWISEGEHVISTLKKLMEEGRLVCSKDSGYLYEVEIPDDNGGNYLDWQENIPSEQMRRILLGFGSLNRKWIEMIQKKHYPFWSTFYGYIRNPKFSEIVDAMVNSEDYSSFFASSFYDGVKKNAGRRVYMFLASLFGSTKAASLYLMNLCGFDGIKYYRLTRWRKPDGASGNDRNYVIFDANKVKIINKEIR